MADNPANNPAKVAGPTCPHCGVGIGEHGANECLDRLVSETVFNVPFVKPKHGPCCTCQTCGHAFDECRCGYSTSIERAWEVVEEMARKGCVDMRFFAGMWYVESADSNGDCYLAPHAPTAPLAICRAAVLAANEKEKA